MKQRAPLLFQNTDVVVLVPVFNEGRHIRQLVRRVQTVFPNVVCVDDGSTDDSAKQIEQTKATLIRHPVNLGQGAALQTAIEYALQSSQNTYFVTFDADDQHSLDDAVKMLSYIRAEKVDIVLGSRFLGSAVNISLAKKLTLHLAVWFSNLLTGVRLTDAHNGLRVFNRSFAEKVDLKMPDFAHATEIIERIRQHNFSYAELPVTITYTNHSTAKGQSIINAINIAFDVLLERLARR